MRGIKVLRLEYWMDDEEMRETMMHELFPCAPVFNRNGYYLRRWISNHPGPHMRHEPGHASHVCSLWFEVDGKAWAFSIKHHQGGAEEMFYWHLGVLNHKPLRECERLAIQQLIYSRLATRAQKDLLSLDNHWHELRDIRRDSLRAR